MNIYLGVDPGVTGALAWLTDDDAGVIDMPKIGKELDHIALRDWWRSVLTMGLRCRATIERAQSMPRQGVSSVFRYGQSYGAVLAICSSKEIPYELVAPSKWRTKMVGAGTDKDASREKAVRLFPALSEHMRRKKDHGRAEALLLAEYGRRYVWQGELVRPETVEDAE